MPEAAIVPDTYNTALEVLARGPKSVKDLERWLKRRDHQPDDIAAAIAKLTERGLLNDEAYAVMFARSRFTTHHMSRRRIGAELARRGVDRAVANAAIDEVIVDESVDERAMLMASAEKKFRSLSLLEPLMQRRRLYGFLARKGYPPDLIRDAVRKLAQ